MNHSRGKWQMLQDAALGEAIFSTSKLNKFIFDRLNGVIECESGVYYPILEVTVPQGYFFIGYSRY